MTGLDDFVATIEKFTAEAAVAEMAEGRPPTGRRRDTRLITRLGEEAAHIRPGDIRHPLRFLRQMAGNPPRRFATSGFRPDVVDDHNPARHYVAFLVVGYWLPMLLALCVLYAWEIAGFVRYGGVWSKRDVRSGMIGLRHGRRVRREGAEVLPKLVRADLGV
jgi:hypothetical protein